MEDVKKSILETKDVKGKGKQGDIIDIPSGHANYLIRSKNAILATVDNLNDQKRKNEQEKIEAQKHLEEMKKLKEELESKEVEIEVRVGKEGKNCRRDWNILRYQLCCQYVPQIFHLRYPRAYLFHVC